MSVKRAKNPFGTQEWGWFFRCDRCNTEIAMAWHDPTADGEWTGEEKHYCSNECHRLRNVPIVRVYEGWGG